MVLVASFCTRTVRRSTWRKLRVQGGFPGGVGLAIAFAVFSFVGFESATAFGAEAKRPLVTIPRAVIGSVIFARAFFVLATYAEIVGFVARRQTARQADSFRCRRSSTSTASGLPAPFRLRSARVCSAFSVCLACITTAGRIAYAMALCRPLPGRASRASSRITTRRTSR